MNHAVPYLVRPSPYTILFQLKLEDRILELQQLNTTDLQKENEAKDAEISELKENTFVSENFSCFSSTELRVLKTGFITCPHSDL